MKKKRSKFRRCLYISTGVVLAALAVLLIWQVMKTPPLSGDWQDKVAVMSTAEFDDDKVTMKNVRNFEYGDAGESSPVVKYYDKTYDLSKLSKVWYITESFSEGSLAAHTFLSFEFSTGEFLSITIESRLTKGHPYSLYAGAKRSYPLIYIAADERDAVYLRANIRKSNIYIYPVRTTPDHAKLLLVDMLLKMNKLTVEPEWYNTISANCTSMIAYHVNKLFPGRLPKLLWQGVLTGYADKVALESGLLDTDLPLDQARKKYYVSERSREIGRVEDYSKLIRQLDSVE